MFLQKIQAVGLFFCCGVIIPVIDILDFLCYIFTRKVAQSPFGLSTGRTIKVAWVAFFLASHIAFIKSISPYCLSSKKFTGY